MRKFITVVPAIRTIPGVEEFDYALHPDTDVRHGDLLRIPFRKRDVLALIVGVSDNSLVADKAVDIGTPTILFRFGDALVQLLHDASAHSFSSKPTVLASWIRQFPKRPLSDLPSVKASTQTQLPVREERFSCDRWNGLNGLLQEAERRKGRTVILTPWQHRANAIAKELDCPAIHSDITPKRFWNAINAFADASSGTIVTTRLGAWLSCIADTILIDEPENDDFKADELQPRLDARWIAARAADHRPAVSLISWATTPKLSSVNPTIETIPSIDLAVTSEPWTKRSGSSIEQLSPQSILKIEEALAQNAAVTIIHPIKGERTRIACRDCGWSAACAFCSFPLSTIGTAAMCKRCGRKGIMPDECPACGGTDLSRGRPGKDRLAAQCATVFGPNAVDVVDPMEFDTHRKADLIVITDLSLLHGAQEDIRKKERLIVGWRRIAAAASTAGALVHVQGSESLLDECSFWLTNKGVASAWAQEMDERRAFGFPPAVPFVKLLIDGDEQHANGVVSDLRSSLPPSWSVSEPVRVEHRSYTRSLRFVVHIRPEGHASDQEIQNALDPFKRRAFIDLDPIAFFS